jgi:hypothetical protein
MVRAMPPTKRPRQSRSPGEIERKFDNQVAAFKSSARDFDEGDLWEAERMSVSIQTLCHSHGQTIGLLSQLGRDSQKFLDSSIEWDEFNKSAHSTLISIAVRANGPSWIAELDGSCDKVKLVRGEVQNRREHRDHDVDVRCGLGEWV